ncbi:GntR family transcriptional regulator [Weissella soli]|uniref:GntR family transcriptional regulator n=1 Tax=Weissella soli TaxID=155866 RepID=UPI001F20B747|nr:GntR family transcriptional regulator [Weissella soli]GJM47950.1 transcriptional regulator [Weissella soli]
MKKYELVANDIKAKIISGYYAKGSILPDQKTLAEDFAVSKITIKNALDNLANAGFVLKTSGFGTVVIGPSTLITDKDAPASNFEGLTDQAGAERVASKVIKFDLEFPSAEVKTHLNINDEEPVYHIIRLRLLDGDPFIIENTYMPVALVPGLSQSVLESSIYTYIHDTLHLKFAGISRNIQARQADELDMRYLNVSKNSAILEIEQIVWLVNGKPIEYSTSRNDSNKRSYYLFETM